MVDSLRQFIFQVLGGFTPLLVAAILGGIIGMERESIERPAGFRTHILVSVGSALIMMVSLEVYRFSPTRADPGRIAAQVVSGIGFLGAGTILRSGLKVRGLTTAASLWVVAGIGLASGMRLYGFAVIASLVILGVLIPLRGLERRVRGSRRRRSAETEDEGEDDADLEE